MKPTSSSSTNTTQSFKDARHGGSSTEANNSSNHADDQQQRSSTFPINARGGFLHPERSDKILELLAQGMRRALECPSPEPQEVPYVPPFLPNNNCILVVPTSDHACTLDGMKIREHASYKALWKKWKEDPALLPSLSDGTCAGGDDTDSAATQKRIVEEAIKNFKLPDNRVWLEPYPQSTASVESLLDSTTGIRHQLSTYVPYNLDEKYGSLVRSGCIQIHFVKAFKAAKKTEYWFGVSCFKGRDEYVKEVVNLSENSREKARWNGEFVANEDVLLLGDNELKRNYSVQAGTIKFRHCYSLSPISLNQPQQNWDDGLLEGWHRLRESIPRSLELFELRKSSPSPQLLIDSFRCTMPTLSLIFGERSPTVMRFRQTAALAMIDSFLSVVTHHHAEQEEQPEEFTFIDPNHTIVVLSRGGNLKLLPLKLMKSRDPSVIAKEVASFVKSVLPSTAVSDNEKAQTVQQSSTSSQLLLETVALDYSEWSLKVKEIDLDLKNYFTVSLHRELSGFTPIDLARVFRNAGLHQQICDVIEKDDAFFSYEIFSDIFVELFTIYLTSRKLSLTASDDERLLFLKKICV
jgi:hypothetical protein